MVIFFIKIKTRSYQASIKINVTCEFPFYFINKIIINKIIMNSEQEFIEISPNASI